MKLLTHSLLAALATLAPIASAQTECEQGCTPGYWGQHPESWNNDGLEDWTQTIFHFQSFNATFSVTPAESGYPDSVTLLEASNLGSGGDDALARHAAAGVASADALLCYDYTVAEVIALYRDGVGADAGPLSNEQAKDLLDSANNAGECPLPDGVSRFCFGVPGSCPCANPSPTGGCANSTGTGALLSRSIGTSSVLADDLVLVATDLPPNQFSIFIAAEGAQNLPFLDGNLCVGGPGFKIVRHNAPTLSSAAGTVTLGPGIVASSNSGNLGLPAIVGIDPGENWYFQVYYRDPAGPCGSGANVSNAAVVMYY